MLADINAAVLCDIHCDMLSSCTQVQVFYLIYCEKTLQSSNFTTDRNNKQSNVLGKVE